MEEIIVFTDSETVLQNETHFAIIWNHITCVVVVAYSPFYIEREGAAFPVYRQKNQVTVDETEDSNSLLRLNKPFFNKLRPEKKCFWNWCSSHTVHHMLLMFLERFDTAGARRWEFRQCSSKNYLFFKKRVSFKYVEGIHLVHSPFYWWPLGHCVDSFRDFLPFDELHVRTHFGTKQKFFTKDL